MLNVMIIIFSKFDREEGHLLIHMLFIAKRFEESKVPVYFPGYSRKL